MNREDFKIHFETLELPIDAGPADVNKAYRLLKEVYETDSLALIAMPEEISAEQTENILAKIEEAHQALAEMFAEEHHSVTQSINRIVETIEDFNGAALREVRLRLNVSLDDVAMETRIGRQHLENVEEDNFDALPVAVYTRGFVMNYAKFLSLDPETVAEGYMANFRKFYADESG